MHKSPQCSHFASVYELAANANGFLFSKLFIYVYLHICIRKLVSHTLHYNNECINTHTKAYYTFSFSRCFCHHAHPSVAQLQCNSRMQKASTANLVHRHGSTTMLMGLYHCSTLQPSVFGCL